jgi:type II secretory pathway pseudopilin PulG
MSSHVVNEFSVDGNGRSSARSQNAFTYLELIIVVAVFVAMLALVALPAWARPKTRSAAAGCLSNLRQLMTGWQMYADDNSGRLMWNAPFGAVARTTWVPPASGWGNIPDNTNTALMLAGLMGKYVNSNVTVFRCPADVVPSANGYRLRSYSMNGQVGAQAGAQNYGSPFRTYSKESDIVCPTPGNLFVFCDEHPGSMDDAYFQVSGSNPIFPNVPASYVDNGCGFSFADGHGEIHKWKGTTLLIPVVPNATVVNVTTDQRDPDWIWFHGKAGCTN